MVVPKTTAQVDGIMLSPPILKGRHLLSARGSLSEPKINRHQIGEFSSLRHLSLW